MPAAQTTGVASELGAQSLQQRSRTAAHSRHLAIASYMLIKLFNGIALGSVARYALLTSAVSDGDVKAFRRLCATLGIIKLFHIGLTAVAVAWLLTPKRIAALVASTTATFIAVTACLATRVHAAQHRGDGAVGPLVDTMLTVGIVGLAVLLQTMDASMDAAFWAQKPYGRSGSLRRRATHGSHVIRPHNCARHTHILHVNCAAAMGPPAFRTDPAAGTSKVPGRRRRSSSL